MQKITEMIVVEGKSDTVAIKRAVDADTIETGGSAIGEHVLKRIALAQQRRGVIIFTDPDHAGERIRKIVSRRVPGCKHAFITQLEATYKDDIGVENASIETIRHALQHVRSEQVATSDMKDDVVRWSDLIDAGLIVHPDASHRRLIVGEILGIGYANGKQFHKRCQMFHITQQEFLAALAQIEHTEGGHRSDFTP